MLAYVDAPWCLSSPNHRIGHNQLRAPQRDPKFAAALRARDFHDTSISEHHADRFESPA